MLSHPQLMARIEQYSFDNPELPKPEFGFIDRLCAETGWRKAFAQGAVAEYRRFVYLSVTGDLPITPSREVDAVWHLHLTYTRSYWERLMPLLPRALHHEPTPGGRAAATTYRQQYAHAKARYWAEFGEWPPDDFWPPEEERFQSDLRKMRGVLSSSEGRDGIRNNEKKSWFRGLAALGIAAAASLTAAPALAAEGDTAVPIAAIMISAGVLVFLLSAAYLSNTRISATPSKKKKDKGDSSAYVGGDGGSSSGGKGKAEGGEGGEAGGDGSGDGGGGCGGGCGS